MSFSPLDPHGDPFPRQQQAHASYISSQHYSEARQSPFLGVPRDSPLQGPPHSPNFQKPPTSSHLRYDSGQTYGNSYNEASPPYTPADSWRPPPLGVPRDRLLQGPPHNSYHPNYQKPPTSSHLRSSHDSGQTYGGSYNEASPPYTSSDSWRPPPLGVPRDGLLQGPPHNSYHPNSQKPPTPSHLRSSHSRRSGFPQNQYSESWRDDESEEDEHQAAHPARYSPSRGSVPTAAAANMHNERLKEKCPPSLDHTGLNFQGTNPPHARVPSTQPPVSNDVPRKAAEPKTKNSKRTDVHPLEAPNKTDGPPTSLTTEQYRRIGVGVDLYPGRFKANLWLAHAFVYTTCMISELSTFRFQNDTKQSTRTHQG